MARSNQIGKHRTSVSFHGLTYVTYHATDVVAFDNEKIILDTGGWFTNTTKLRMNQASNQFSLGYSVFQKNHQWYVTYCGKTVKFDGDSVTFQRV